MAINMTPLSCSKLASYLEKKDSTFLLIDTRPSAQHCSKHIESSENINFSNILLRRLLKQVVQLSTLIPSKGLAQRLASRDSEQEIMIVYDSCSKRDSIKTELVKHSEVLAKTNHGKDSDKTVYFLDGGFNAFSAGFSHLCTMSSATGKKTHSPLGISVSASLPLFGLPGPCKKKYPKLRTPSEESCGQFGPPVEILPHLVLGCAKDSSNLTVLRKHGVTAVLNVSHNCPNHFESLLEYNSISVHDSYQADLLSKMDAAIDYMDSIKSKNGCVFVHCHAGISRSATICIAYIMKTMQWGLSRAYEFVKQKRPCISPNLHFMGQLLEFEKKLQEPGEVKMELRTDDKADSDVDAPLPHTFNCSTTQYVPMHNCTSPMVEEEDGGSSHCSSMRCSSTTTIPSASAPSSLNFDNNNSQVEPMILCEESLQVLTEPSKPTTLPLFQSCHILKTSTDRLVLYGLKREGPPLSSASLPATPISHYKDHLPPTMVSPLSQRTLSTLQLSPCRMAAKLGSRSESCLNHYNHTPLTESM